MSKTFFGDIVQRFDLNQSLCNLCGTCVDMCDKNALTIQDGTLYFNPCRCRRCDGCYGLCPKGAMKIELFVINQREYDGYEHQERYWEINSSCHITCDGVTCNECGRNKDYNPRPYDKPYVAKKVEKQITLGDF